MQMDAAQSLGVYMILLTHLRKMDGYEASCCPLCLESITRMYDLDSSMLHKVLFDFNLFVVDEERQMFRSPYLDRVMGSLEKRRAICAENGKRGGRPKHVEKTLETPDSKGEKPNQNQKSREEESRVTTVVLKNNSSNEENKETAAANSSGKKKTVLPQQLKVVSSREDERQLPLEPILSWEALVDCMAESEEYMDLMALHSCLGLLFKERKNEIIEAFKTHIRQFGKEGGLLFMQDVKSYFANYLSPGSRPAKELKKKLDRSSRRLTGENLYRFEQVSNGHRMYLGHPIPEDAPPRPDASAVWDEVHRKWGH